jgi:hypothetical protein
MALLLQLHADPSNPPPAHSRRLHVLYVIMNMSEKGLEHKSARKSIIIPSAQKPKSKDIANSPAFSPSSASNPFTTSPRPSSPATEGSSVASDLLRNVGLLDDQTWGDIRGYRLLSPYSQWEGRRRIRVGLSVQAHACDLKRQLAGFFALQIRPTVYGCGFPAFTTPLTSSNAIVHRASLSIAHRGISNV